MSEEKSEGLQPQEDTGKMAGTEGFTEYEVGGIVFRLYPPKLEFQDGEDYTKVRMYIPCQMFTRSSPDSSTLKGEG